MRPIKQYLGARELLEGARPPRFYLPVLSPIERHAYELWPFPLAPFVVIWQILSGCGWLIWRDLIDVTKTLKDLRNL